MEPQQTPRYIFAESPTETERLSYNHDAIVASFGKLLFVPVDLSKPGLRVLDSTCNDGCWLRALQSIITAPSYELVGADISENFFPTSHPHAQYIRQSMTDPWPAALHNSFDLVHQRLALAFCGPTGKPMQTAIDGLFSIARPGAWIQLVEPEYYGRAGDAPPMQSFAELCRTGIGILGNADVRYAAAAGGMLARAGCVDIDETVVDVAYGAAAKDEHTRAVTKRSLLLSTADLVGMARGKGLSSSSDEELDQLPSAIEKELDGPGVHVPYRVIWGRKPM